MLKYWKKIYRSLDGSEKRFIFITIILTILLTLIPLVLGLMLETPDQHYTDAPFVAGADRMVYFSQIEEIRQGGFLTKNLYTSEQQNPAIFSPLWIITGWLSKLTSLPNYLAFHLMRVILACLFLFLLYLFISRIFKKVKWRRIAFLILCFGSGLGIFTLSGNWQPDFLYEYLGTDIWVSEGNTFLTIFHSPLFILSQLLILIIFWWLIERLGRAKLKEVFLIGLVIAILGIIHPYDLFIVFFVGGIWFLLESLRRKKFFKKILVKLLLLGLIGGLLPTVYFYWLTATNSAFNHWMGQNVTLSPKITNYFIGYGLLLVFYLLAIFKTTKSKNKYLFFLSIWSIVGWFLLFIPIQFQRRLANGLHIPIAIIAVFGLIKLTNFFKKKKFYKNLLIKPLVIIVITFFLITSTIFALGANLVMILWQKYPTYITIDDYQAMLWYKDIGANEIILSSAASGNVLPAITGRQVYIGHGHQTSNWLFKINFVHEVFYKSNNLDNKKEAWLKEQGIDYVFYGFYEDRLGEFNPFEKKYLEPVWQQGKTAIFRVK